MLTAPWPVLSSKKVSLVDVSPSTVMRLKLASATRRTQVCNSSGAILASVAIMPSMVAMLGRIMPAPLEMPVITTSPPGSFTRRDTALGSVSVVMMASAASAQCAGARSATASGTPAVMRSTGRCSRITPVDIGSTVSAGTPSAAATA